MNEVTIPVNCSIELSIQILRRKWIVENRLPGETMKDIARRLDVSARTIMRWMNGDEKDKKNGKKYRASRKNHKRFNVGKDNIGKCFFCGTAQDLQQHHVHGIAKDIKTIMDLCGNCHKRFHVLNAHYKLD